MRNWRAGLSKSARALGAGVVLLALTGLLMGLAFPSPDSTFQQPSGLVVVSRQDTSGTSAVWSWVRSDDEPWEPGRSGSLRFTTSVARGEPAQTEEAAKGIEAGQQPEQFVRYILAGSMASAFVGCDRYVDENLISYSDLSPKERDAVATWMGQSSTDAESEDSADQKMLDEARSQKYLVLLPRKLDSVVQPEYAEAGGPRYYRAWYSSFECSFKKSAIWSGSGGSLIGMLPMSIAVNSPETGTELSYFQRAFDISSPVAGRFIFEDASVPPERKSTGDYRFSSVDRDRGAATVHRIAPVILRYTQQENFYLFAAGITATLFASLVWEFVKPRLLVERGARQKEARSGGGLEV